MASGSAIVCCIICCIIGLLRSCCNCIIGLWCTPNAVGDGCMACGLPVG